MRLLVVGQGGREHALAWALKQSRRNVELFATPGNAGIASLGECHAISADDVDGIAKFAKAKKIDLVIIGPELALVKGIVDRLKREGVPVFGPDQYASQLEGSKIFSKELMRRLSIPTADFRVFDEPQKAKDYIAQKGAPIVIKADGLAAGKGVTVAATLREAHEAIDQMMVQKSFGSAGTRVLVEECLQGVEASLIAISDGKSIRLFASSQDHKRAYDNDEGPNTGGMGAYSPAPFVTAELEKEAEERIFAPLIRDFQEKGHPIQGFIYAGVMLTAQGMQVLEFNVRFGDPEAQAILPRLKSDFLDLLVAAQETRLDQFKLEWKPEACLCVVLASGGYPSEYKKGCAVNGLTRSAGEENLQIFHAGTEIKQNNIVTAGGRVFGVSALGQDLADAKDKAYKAVGEIHFDGMQYRKDIGSKAIQANANS